ncbi:MAG TPA: hypothetical protein VEH86_08560, partial [Candidatus Acidoferrum sp.]|nr:hypothetical protein [Candidatus Acidoferrum sp.]
MTRPRASESTVKYTWHNTMTQEVKQPDNCRILVAGVGGAGCNTVTRLMEMHAMGIECVAINTDAVHLRASKADQKILIGEKLTRGFGVGGNPELGRSAIEESRACVEEMLRGVDIVFLTTGLGGGTGTGAAPIVAEI